MRRPLILLLSVVACGLSLTGAALAQSHTYPTSAFSPEYLTAVDLCENGINTNGDMTIPADPDYVSTHLVPIDKTTTPTTLVTVYTDYTGYVPGATTLGAGTQVWASPGTSFYDWHIANGTTPEEMDLRTKQLLGMPSFKENDRVVELYAPTEDMFRPSRDPDMNTTTSATTIPTVPDYNTLPREFYNDPTIGPGVNRTDEEAWTAYQTWLQSNADWSYDGTGTHVPYPWTTLGYTYDWGGEEGDIEGLSEYIIYGYNADLGGGETATTLDIRLVASASSYICLDRDPTSASLGSYDITGDVDTVWAGTDYIDAVGTNLSVLVRKDATVWQGIDLSSGGFTLTNHGMIYGPGKNLDRSLRESAIRVQEDATIVNLKGAVIGGTRVGIDGVQDDGSPATGAIDIVNQGTIFGTEIAIQTGDGADSILNQGTLVGDVETGAGGDTIELRESTTIGNIDGGADADELIFNAGAGNTASLYGDIDGVETITMTSGIAALEGHISSADLNVVDQTGLAVGGQGGLGILNTDQAVTLETGGTWYVDLYKPNDATSNCDIILATGNITFEQDSIIEIDALSGSASPIREDENFIIAMSEGIISWTNVELSTDSAFLEFTRDPGDSTANKTVTIRPHFKASFESLAEGTNNRSVAAALGDDYNTSSGSYASMLNDLAFSNATEYGATLPNLNPQAYHAMNRASRRLTQDLAAGLADHLRQRRRGLGGTPWSGTATTESRARAEAFLSTVMDDDADESDWANDYDQTIVRQQNPRNPLWDLSAFSRPFGTFFYQNAGIDRTGFQANASGVQLALDRALSCSVIGGIEFDYGYNHVAFLDNGGTGRIDTFRVGPYFTWFNDENFFDFSCTYGYHDNKVDRVASYVNTPLLAEGKYKSHDISTYFGIGRDINYGPWVATPEASLQYIYYTRDEVFETGAAGANTQLFGDGSHSLRSQLGLRFTRELWSTAARACLFEIGAGWAHEFLADDSYEGQFLGGVNRFEITPGPLWRDSGYTNVGLSWDPTEGVNLFTRYRGEFSEGGSFHAMDVGLAINY